MPATRSRTSTEQAEAVAAEEVVKKGSEESVDLTAPEKEEIKETAPSVDEESVEKAAADEVVEQPEAAVEEPEEKNGDAAKESNGNGAVVEDAAVDVEKAEENGSGGEKRKSMDGGDVAEDVGPDSTEITPKKAKVATGEEVDAEGGDVAEAIA